MAAKLYFHNAANALSGTFPTGEQSAATPTHTDSGATTLRTMDGTIGTSQVAVQVTHDNTINTRYRHFYRFFCSTPLSGAQTVGGGTATVNLADEFDAVNINHWAGQRVCVYVWRPSTGAIVGTLFDGITSGGEEPTASNSEQVTIVTFSTSAISAAGGDVVICEVWSDHFVGGNRVNADTFFYYDGTTENTTENAVVSNHASYIELAETLVFEGEGGAAANRGLLLMGVGA